MTKLKTLKDLIEHAGSLRYENIKQEAIKWVKEGDIDNKLAKDCVDWRDIFMKFHNFTEEDLK